MCPLMRDGLDVTSRKVATSGATFTQDRKDDRVAPRHQRPEETGSRIADATATAAKIIAAAMCEGLLAACLHRFDRGH